MTDRPIHDKLVYDKLADIFNQIGFTRHITPELLNLLQALFNETEAEIAVNLSPFAPEPAAEVAKKMNRNKGEIEALLNQMADKGLIYASKRDGVNWYKTIQLVPGIFELQFMKGETTDRAKKLAKLFDAYSHSMKRDPIDPETPVDQLPVNFARVIPIEKSFSPEITVYPYEEISSYIDTADHITVSTCYCRHEKRLLDRGCQYPDEVCLQLGPFSRFVKERGFGRAISKEEAHEIIKKSADAGLIHTASNTKNGIDFICNCCTCCCGILQGVAKFNMPVRTLSSNYEAVVNETDCSGCGECVEKCQMDAVVLAGEVVKISLDRCIGCGVCVHLCPTSAMGLQSRSVSMEPPGTFKELVQKQMAGTSRQG